MDFYRIAVTVEKDGTILVYPDWQVDRSEDLMVQGGKFFAFWDSTNGLWSRDEFRLRQVVDASLFNYVKRELEPGTPTRILTTKDFSTKMWKQFNDFIKNFPQSYVQLDSRLTFADTEVKKSDYVSRRLAYSLEEGTTEAWDELVGVLYSDEERDKFEWAIGSIVTGASKDLQKFFVFYGPPASGKSTVLNIVQKLFRGYVTSFDAKALGGGGNSFATDVFKNNPLVAIQHDGDLSRIENNARLNSITSHEEMTMNEKYKASYSAKVNALLFMGTNKPVQITDAKAGTIRRLIDVHPTGVRVAAERYHILMEQINFELGAIAHTCAEKFKKMGKHYYEGYKPEKMMYQTDEFYNFVSYYFDVFKSEDGITLKRAWDLYKEYCEEVNITKLMRYSMFREELNMYFETFEDRAKLPNGEWVRSYYSGFNGIPKSTPFVPDTTYVIDLKPVDSIYGDTESIFDRLCAEQPAQQANNDGNPAYYWDDVTTTLADMDPSKLHFVRVPENHIVIDFDLVDEDGEKDIELNLEAASQWPATYAEVSKGGAGIHLHYLYTGDVHELENVYDVGIEIKTLLGKGSLRRRLTKCNTLDISSINGGLPIKEKKDMLHPESIKTEKGLRDLILRNLRKEIHAGTKPSIDFIHHILEEAYDDSLSYDVSDLHPKILSFALQSTHQSQRCVQIVKDMKFTGKIEMPEHDGAADVPLVFFDVEVYPNLFVVCWKYRGSDQVVRMINPSPVDIEALFQLKLVGFNNRRYDNHILYARYLGYSTEELYKMSSKLINDKNRNVLIGEAYGLSYTDIYDFSAKKQGLKKFMLELGITHMEMDIPWDQPVPEDMWESVLVYCENDVRGTEAVFEARYPDFVARQMLSSISGLTVNDTTQRHTAKIIFGKDKEPQKRFIYTDLSKEFPGYEYNGRESLYRGEVTGEGGYVYAEPGIYENVALLDVASMHPTTAINLDLFGPYTKNFKALMDARLAIKHRDFERARGDDILGGRLREFLVDAESDPAGSEALAYALKIVINIVYGLTSASFPNPFRDNRNKDNIVAKRGALFMIDLKHEVQERGFTVVHIKTDSIKIANPTPEIIDFVFEFGKKSGYDFEHEATYEKFCLVNDAVYIARSNGSWTAVGKQFQHPYVYKSLFSKEPIEFDDFREIRNVVQGTMLMAPDGVEDVSKMVHVGRTGSFIPVMHGGGTLWRVKEDKQYAVTGTKGYKWLQHDAAAARKDEDLVIDMSYFEALETAARAAIEKFGSYEELIK